MNYHSLPKSLSLEVLMGCNHFLKGRTIRKVKGGGAGEVQRKIRARKNKTKKIHARQLILKKYSSYGLEKIHTRNLITKKIPAARKFSSPHNFSNGPSLRTIERLRISPGSLGEMLVYIW